jgi:hypothetical protein
MKFASQLSRFVVPAVLAGTFALASSAPIEPQKRDDVLPKIALPPEGGFAVPEYGEDTKIDLVYLAPDNHLIIAFSYKDKGVLMSDMYDTISKRRIFPDKAYQAARDNSVEFGFVRENGLRMLGTLEVVKKPSEWKIWSVYDGGRICPNNRYFSDIEIDRNGKTSAEFQLFAKLPKPEQVRLDPDCGVAEATYGYADLYPIFYSNDDGFLAETGRFLIWFDWTGTSPFLKGRDDIVAVPTAAISPVLNEDREEGLAASAAAISKADAIIADFGRKQMERK